MSDVFFAVVCEAAYQLDQEELSRPYFFKKLCEAHGFTYELSEEQKNEEV